MIIYLDEFGKITNFRIKRIVRKIVKQNKKEKIKLVLSENMSKIDFLIKKLQENKIEILDGRWIFRFLIYEVIDYICYCQNKDINKQNVCLLINERSEDITETIYSIAPKVKSFKVVTNNTNSFLSLENDLYEEYGIPIQISNNTRKSLNKADIIVNVDFDEELFNKYIINPKSIVINLKNKININTKRFQGININYYKINYNKQILDKFENNIQYDKNILYESYIYRKDTYINIKNQIKKDNVKIITLIGNNGEVSKDEYLKIS